MRRNGAHRIYTALAESPSFHGLPAAHLQELAAIGRVTTLRRGQACSGGLCLVLDGALRLSSVTAHGQEFVVAHLGPGQIAGLAAIMRRPASPFAAHAVGRATVAVFPAQALRALFDERPPLWRHFAGLIYDRLVQTLLLARDVGVAPLSQRLARRLIWQAHASSAAVDGDAPVRVCISQTELARMLGAARSVVNAALKRFEQAGAVSLGYSSIDLLDMAALRQMAGPDLVLP